MTLVLSNEDVSKLLTMRDVIDVLEDAYVELAEGRGVNRTRSDSLSPTSYPEATYGLKSMDGIVPKLGVGAVRINSDIVTWPKRGNNVRREKVPAAPNNRWVGLVLLFSTHNGEPLAIFPDGVMQRTRVGATNGLGAKYLSRPDAQIVGILGSGWQAGTQLRAVCAVRNIKTIRCFSPSKENREKFAREMSDDLGITVQPVSQPEDAIKGADIAMCASNSIDSIFFSQWVEPGMHLSEIKRPEIEFAALEKADRIAIHTKDPHPLHFTTKDLAMPEKIKGKGWAEAKATIDITTLPTLPELIVGRAKGRDNPEQVTAFLNNMGMGFQFAAAGSVLYRKAVAAGAGHDLPTDWFTEDVHP